MLNNKTILVTGGTGSFGKKFIDTALNRFQLKEIILSKTSAIFSGVWGDLKNPK